MVQLHPSWLQHLKDEFDQPYMKELKAFLLHEKEAGHRVFPPSAQIFEALNKTPFDAVKIVILGQDPYHGLGQANGLCFSVHKNIPIPPSLKNMYKELESDIGLPIPSHGSLNAWAEQGVLLLNATLTVREAAPGSHQKKGWEQFTDRIIELLNAKRDNLVFLLWGNFARSKKPLITRHSILEAAHPSPFSAHSGFMGCKHFSQSNRLLVEKGIQPIDWQII